MTLLELKEIAKELGIKNISKFKKSQLIEEIAKLKINSINKNGVVLTEKIAPKTVQPTENNIKNNKLEIKAEDYISSLYNNPITLTFEPSEINTDLWNTLIMPQND